MAVRNGDLVQLVAGNQLVQAVVTSAMDDLLIVAVRPDDHERVVARDAVLVSRRPADLPDDAVRTVVA